MFTGIIEEVGHLSRIEPISGGIRLTVAAERILSDLKVDDSVAINGVCQTAVSVTENGFAVEAVGETLEKTTLGQLRVHSPVNLERALTLNTRLGGHLLQGHVNCVGRIVQLSPRGKNYYLQVSIPPQWQRYNISEGSIALDGISLTIARVFEDGVGINVIPHTVEHTNLKNKRPGDTVNVEIDILARYIEHFVKKGAPPQPLDIDTLKKWGY
ncbi:MAG: riboflavin synthase [Calditrichia bacterium]